MIKHTVGKVLIRWSGANPMSISKSFKKITQNIIFLFLADVEGSLERGYCLLGFFNLTLFHTGHISRCSQTSLCMIMPRPHRLEPSLSTQEHYRMQSRWRCAMPWLTHQSCLSQHQQELMSLGSWCWKTEDRGGKTSLLVILNHQCGANWRTQYAPVSSRNSISA